MKVPLPVVKFMLSQTYLSQKLASWLTKIQEHYLVQIKTANTIKGRDLALDLPRKKSSHNSDSEDEVDPRLICFESQFSNIFDHVWYKKYHLLS